LLYERAKGPETGVGQLQDVWAVRNVTRLVGLIKRGEGIRVEAKTGRSKPTYLLQRLAIDKLSEAQKGNWGGGEPLGKISPTP